jgi:ribosomal protein S27AE
MSKQQTNAASMKAIQTSYSGYLFRSRLEARWGVWFGAVGLQWEYEPEGFALPDGARYLPDFRVYTPQRASCWYEIKPATVKEDAKFSAFRAALYDEWNNRQDKNFGTGPSPRATLLSGDPYEWFGAQNRMCPRCGDAGQVRDRDYCVCDACDWETPGGRDNPEEMGILGILCRPNTGWILFDEIDDRRLSRAVMAAATAARSARFEYGETPSFSRRFGG